MLVGKITKIDKEMGYGFISVAGHSAVLFSKHTNFVGINLNGLAFNQRVSINVKQTLRGPFAADLKPLMSVVATAKKDLQTDTHAEA